MNSKIQNNNNKWKSSSSSSSNQNSWLAANVLMSNLSVARGFNYNGVYIRAIQQHSDMKNAAPTCRDTHIPAVHYFWFMNLQICATENHIGACCKHLHIRGAIYKGENFLESDSFFHSSLSYVYFWRLLLLSMYKSVLTILTLTDWWYSGSLILKWLAYFCC